MAKTHTSREVKDRYDKKTYSRFIITLRKEDDKKILDYIEKRRADGDTITAIFRDAVDALLQSENE